MKIKLAAWAAGQAILGKTKTLPEKPQLDSKGLWNGFN